MLFVYQLSTMFCSIRFLIVGCVHLSPYHPYYNRLFCYMPLFYLFFVHSFDILPFKINYRLWYEGTLKYLGGVSQVLKLGYERHVMVYAWWGIGNRLGMPVDVQVLEGFSHPNVEADDSDIIWWHHWCPSYVYWGRYKRKHTQDWGVQSFILSVFLFGSFGLFPS